ncbi:BgTH12-05966 [Blumeria graminis f. sp. triticale]|uniref:Bgt-1914 n=3 Tax=Blumeria graminis TaxID=34373 RepID=A0A9X9MKF9_BLUGR|nr:hypothetical protein BGT96224_1914 [Blumeria graminis f. sp. tritici 96224]CAD6504233.1 BgTH12-05966 [Blumeria graminis f. sp. triticale]VDB91048.1 Bgt-1914 [Blumeria graminis f. sp. tritici]
MNNSQFRKLVNENYAPKSGSPVRRGPSLIVQDENRSSTLGSRARNSFPMTPRSVADSSYSTIISRQSLQRQKSPVNKKFRSSEAPKGSKLPEGYVDRTKSRVNNNEHESINDKAERVKSLEEVMKLGQIDELTFVKLRDEILGDEIGMERAGLVKGLDWGLLKKVKMGEVDAQDVITKSGLNKSEDREQKIDDGFDELEAKQIQPLIHKSSTKKGVMAPSLLTGKRNRNQILAELKASRESTLQATTSRLGCRFKRVGEPRPKTKIEKDRKGRDVMISIDENGNEKRKVRRTQKEVAENERSTDLLMPDKSVKPLGMEVPEIPQNMQSEECLDIFEDVGDDYSPLAELDGDDESDTEEIGTQIYPNADATKTQAEDSKVQPSNETLTPQAIVRDYFKATNMEIVPADKTSAYKTPGLLDPTILATLQKASKISLRVAIDGNDEDEAKKVSALREKEERHKRMLMQDDRDDQDIDMGFGSSRLEDEADACETEVQLSKWSEDDVLDGSNTDNRKKRKRRSKKMNSAVKN